MNFRTFLFLLFAAIVAMAAPAFGAHLDPAATVVTAMALAIPAQGVVLKVSVPGSPSLLLAVANITGFNLSAKAPEIDVTNLDSAAANVLVGVPKWNFTFDGNLDPDNSRHQELRAAIANRTLIEFSLLLTDATPQTAVGQGYVTDWSVRGAVNDKVGLSGAIAVDGGVTFA